jgi:hypothetical protein
MAKRGRKPKEESNEQGTLMEIGPKHSKEITAVAKKYKAAQAERLEALGREKDLKEQLLAMVKDENLQPVDGKIKFRVNGLEITVTPRDELIQVKEETEE